MLSDEKIGTYIRRNRAKLAQNLKEDVCSIKSFGSSPVKSAAKMI